MLKAINRLKKEADFQRLFEQGKKVKYGPLLLFSLPTEEPLRLGVVVSKKVNKKAVRRNYLRRILQDVARLLIANQPTGVDVVAVVLYDPADAHQEFLKALQQWFKNWPSAS